MSWLVAIVVVLVGVTVFVSLAGGSYQIAYSDEILNEFRQQNANLCRERFGPEEPTDAGAWHRVLSQEEKPIVWAGNGVLLGLRQVSMLEDESGRHWRVVVAHEKGKPPYFEAKELSGAS